MSHLYKRVLLNAKDSVDGETPTTIEVGTFSNCEIGSKHRQITLAIYNSYDGQFVLAHSQNADKVIEYAVKYSSVDEPSGRSIEIY